MAKVRAILEGNVVKVYWRFSVPKWSPSKNRLIEKGTFLEDFPGNLEDLKVWPMGNYSIDLTSSATGTSGLDVNILVTKVDEL